MQDTQTTAPPVMKAADDLGFKPSRIAKMLGKTPFQISHWRKRHRPIPPVYHVALVGLFLMVRNKVASDPPHVDPVQERDRQVWLSGVDRWLELARQDIEKYSGEVVTKGQELGASLWAKWCGEAEKDELGVAKKNMKELEAMLSDIDEKMAAAKAEKAAVKARLAKLAAQGKA